MADKNKISVRIAGIEYSIMSTEPNEYMQKIALYVDKKIADLMGSHDKLGSSMATVLAAINIADELYRSQSNNRMLKEALARNCEEIEKCRKEIAALKANKGLGSLDKES